MDINKYISTYYPDFREQWFVQEVKSTRQRSRISEVQRYMEYLSGSHSVFNREDGKFKNKTFVTRKILMQNIKTIVNFHTSYLVGEPVIVTGAENRVSEYKSIYESANYDFIDYQLVDKVNKFGDAYEYIYYDRGNIKSRVIDPIEGYPVYGDSGDYLAFIQFYVVEDSHYYTVYYSDRVEEWSNTSGLLQRDAVSSNLSGLPIHYHNLNDMTPYFGESMLHDMIPLLDEMEDVMSKFGDAIGTWALNPIPVISGQRIESAIPASAMGYILNLEDGSTFEVPTTTLDTESIKLYIENLKQALLEVSNTPSIVFSQQSISNISETSIKIMYQLAHMRALMTERFYRLGLYKRFEAFDLILEKQGITFGAEDYYEVEFDYGMPQNTTEVLENLQKQQNMGAISTETIIERSPLTSNVKLEQARISREQPVAEEVEEMEGGAVND